MEIKKFIDSVSPSVLHIKYRETAGTGFILNHGRTKFLVTAKHIVYGMTRGVRDAIYILDNNNSWQIRLANLKEELPPLDNMPLSGDIAIIEIDFLGNEYGIDSNWNLDDCNNKQSRLDLNPMDFDIKDIVRGTEVYIFGYPYDLAVKFDPLSHREIQTPFVKKGVIASTIIDTTHTNTVTIPSSEIIVHAYVAGGFSGGPVIYQKDEKTLAILGVVKATWNEFIPKNPHPIKSGLTRLTPFKSVIDLLPQKE